MVDEHFASQSHLTIQMNHSPAETHLFLCGTASPAHALPRVKGKTSPGKTLEYKNNQMSNGGWEKMGCFFPLEERQ